MINKVEEYIRKQKQEKEAILSEQYITRIQNDNPAQYLGNNLIKIITGPRRCGKSVFAFLLLKGQDFSYINLEDANLLSAIKDNHDILTDNLELVYGKTKYVLFDEIQNLNMWQMFLNKLHRRGYNIIVTGSNANLLSGALATSLTGRHIPIDLLPFSFQEFLKYKFPGNDIDQINTMRELRQYMSTGGFPEIVTSNIVANVYTDNLLKTTIYKDVVFNHKIRVASKIDDLAAQLIANCCKEFSYLNLSRILEVKSSNTISKYVGYLEETFLFFSLNKFSYKHKEQITSNKKIYIVDNGILTSQNRFDSPSDGTYFENMIFIELLRRKYRKNIDLFYYKTKNNKEIDFILKENFKVKELIQVCYDLKDPKTENREVSALLEASEELKCDNLTIINWDTEKTEVKDGKTIKYIPA